MYNLWIALGDMTREWVYSRTPFQILTMAGIMEICGIICVITMLVCRWQYAVKKEEREAKIGKRAVMIQNRLLKKIYRLCMPLSIGLFAFAALNVIWYTHLFNTAVKYGAYGDFYRKNTVGDILANTESGFPDQSKDVPKDPKGCVILFYKWGCADCVNIHDALLAKLEEYDLYKTYFVSVKSERGRELLEQYPMDSVPSGIYIRYDDANGGYQGYVLNDGKELNEYNLDTLLSVQTYIRCFDLPEEYQHDAMKELPDKYKDIEETTENQ